MNSLGPQSGCFIVFEGIEGAGKSTQLQLLHDALKKNYPICQTREPGGTSLGNALRHVLLDPATGDISGYSEFLIFASARAMHVSEHIKPALAAGKIVLCDRFSAASVAYQGYGRGINKEFIDSVNFEVCNGLSPDLTILFDLDPRLGLQRVRQRQAGKEDRIESSTVDFHRRVRQGYLSIADANKNCWKVIDAVLPEQEQHSMVMNTVGTLLRKVMEQQ